MHAPGRIVILNGAPRAGKSSIAAAIQERFDGVWMHLGVDLHVRHVTPPRYRPGIGLRPGGERPDLEPLVPRLYAALYDSIAAHARQGLDVVVDVGHHDGYSRPLGILSDCAGRLAGLPVLFVGVRCPLAVIMERRLAGAADRAGAYVAVTADGPVPDPVLRWQAAVHDPGLYDLEVDTGVLSPEACAEAIAERLARPMPGPSAFERLAGKG
ncbi:chloramphenicol phosphotransferase CPT family protein [Prosthecomicrobium pneumaticum]|uniref:Chloramphenicol 3-O phosphotransferase n=1 Tax=Prosthecomicrobium pneumaticum TaxID=81895 RepID=A0A7W9FKK1_9HYPH|nr:chloramphenicol phosphotransferase [Prosthecomicrobium pneumaticum]MBB5750973.1 chloramphenicol 3-O phosphotransferase [Prosthecomicrobium pneumaticum]